MMELEWDVNQAEEELDCTTHQFGNQILGGRSFYRADVEKSGLIKDIGVVLLATLALWFTGVIGGKVIMEALDCRDLKSQIEQRLFEVTR